MQQLTQKLGSGEMVIQEIPYPQVGMGMILVKTHYSIISAGTESSTVKAARKSLIGKAKERPQQVKQVFDTLKKQGVVQTYRAVMKKLDAYSPLGYSCAGEIIELGEGVLGFEVGDYVACAGAGYANHAEIVTVPVNLCVKLNKPSNLKNAAYNTLGAIAMQGVRQADLRLGENCVVIGLGLLGQLACLILKASGINVIGVDITEHAVKLANDNNVVDIGIVRTANGIEDQINNATNGIGADAVIIAAATSSLDPINFAGSVARKKGKVVILGAVPTGFDRDPHWYRKELELKMACSYGPGRYDLNYEEKGIDYPIAYVRWTEKRNMEAFQHLLASRKIDIDYLTTHEFNFEEATKAFDLVVNGSEPYLGIALKYNIEKDHSRKKISTHTSFKGLSDINLSFIGAGSYAQGNLLPNIPSSEKIRKIGVLTNTGTTSKRVAEKYKFQFCTSNESDVLNASTNTLFVATRHDSHGSFVLKGLKANKNVFVEKPLCLSEEELFKIQDEQRISGKSIMVGFNRRFSKFSKLIKSSLANGPVSMIYRVNAGSIPVDHWIQDIDKGGGRIIGEVCHFIDFMTFICGSPPSKVSAQVLKEASNRNDTINILLQFENGSIGTIAYYSNGSNKMPKEYIEVFSSGTSIIINDFKELKIYGGHKIFTKKVFRQDKGQKQMMEVYLNSLLKTGDSIIPQEDIFKVTLSTFKVLESINNGGKQIEL